MAAKRRAGRNRTLFLSDEERSTCLARCIPAADVGRLNPSYDVTVCGDTFLALAKLPDEFVDLLIVDPPYNLEKTYGNNKFRKMDQENYETYTIKWVEAALHTLKKTASVYVCCDWRSSLTIGRILNNYFIIQNRITWQREKGRGAMSNWKNSMEDIWFATMSNKYTFNVDAVKQRRRVIAPYRENGQPKDWHESADGRFRDTHPSNFWDDISVPYWSMPENTDHPTQKPEKLAAKMILASSNPGDTILDPFVGSGTSSVAACKLDRHYVGIEIEEQYCALAEKRLELARSDCTIQGYAGGVFWERNSLSEQKKMGGPFA